MFLCFSNFLFTKNDTKSIITLMKKLCYGMVPHFMVGKEQKITTFDKSGTFCGTLLVIFEGFSFMLKPCFAFFILCSCCLSYAYTPAALQGKYQTGIIDYNFYYRKDAVGGGKWMPKLADYYGGRENANAILGIRRTVVPSTLVAWDGSLFTLSLRGFGYNGPEFKLAKYMYSNGSITQISITYDLWTYVFDKDNLNLALEPYLDGNAQEETYFKRGFHNVFQPCIFQEVETPTVATSTFIRTFYYVPNRRMFRANSSDLMDFEGGYGMKFSKENLDLSVAGADKGDGANNYLGWEFAPVNWVQKEAKLRGRANPKSRAQFGLKSAIRLHEVGIASNGISATVP